MMPTAITIAAITIYYRAMRFAFNGFMARDGSRHTFGLVIMLAAGLVAGSVIG